MNSYNNYIQQSKIYMELDNFQSRPSREGQNNPMWGRKQSDEARRKQSEAAKRRAADYKKWRDSQEHTTMDEFLMGESFKRRVSEILREELIKVVQKRAEIPLF